MTVPRYSAFSICSAIIATDNLKLCIVMTGLYCIHEREFLMNDAAAFLFHINYATLLNSYCLPMWPITIAP